MNRAPVSAVPSAPRWTWRVTLASLACTLALFMAVPLLETLRTLNVSPTLTVREMPEVVEPPPPPPPVSLPDSSPPAEAAEDVIPVELSLPPPPPLLPAAPAMSMPAVFTPSEWTTDPLRVQPLAPPGPQVFDIGQIDQAPVPRSQLRPLYPPRARLHRVEGWVDLEFVVTAEGGVRDVRVTGASPEDTFDRSAVQAASRWRFTPGRHQNQPVPVRVRQRITFELQ